MQVAEAKTSRAEVAAETLQLQVDVTAAERGAEISKLEMVRDESLQAAAALRRRLEGAETAHEQLQAAANPVPNSNPNSNPNPNPNPNPPS